MTHVKLIVKSAIATSMADPPSWQRRPTCAGTWVLSDYDGITGTFQFRQEDFVDGAFKQPVFKFMDKVLGVYGPIPERPENLTT